MAWLAGAAAVVLAGSAWADPPHQHEGGGRGHEAPQGRGERGGPPGHWDRGGPPGRWDGGGPDRGGPVGPQGWDSRRYNGYWIGRRWNYGAPPNPVFDEPGYRPGFTPWRPGAYLPPDYQGFAVDDYWRFHLRRPPNGYHWVQVGDEFLLVSMATGQVFDVVTGF